MKRVILNEEIVSGNSEDLMKIEQEYKFRTCESWRNECRFFN